MLANLFSSVNGTFHKFVCPQRTFAHCFVGIFTKALFSGVCIAAFFRSCGKYSRRRRGLCPPFPILCGGGGGVPPAVQALIHSRTGLSSSSPPSRRTDSSGHRRPSPSASSSSVSCRSRQPAMRSASAGSSPAACTETSTMPPLSVSKPGDSASSASGTPSAPSASGSSSCRRMRRYRTSRMLGTAPLPQRLRRMPPSAKSAP